jgi:hypothetical protein
MKGKVNGVYEECSFSAYSRVDRAAGVLDGLGLGVSQGLEQIEREAGCE